MRVKELLDYLKDCNPKASVELLTQNEDGEEVWHEVQDVWADTLDENVYLEFGIKEMNDETQVY
tara:strand:+ start:625 stop:816 length:192 start_codon:yes stop_codon:yes gene_type:complete